MTGAPRAKGDHRRKKASPPPAVQIFSAPARAEEAPRPFKAFHLVNASGGAAWARRTLLGRDPRAPWTVISRDHPRHTETVLEWALAEEVTRLVVWGGDGTFHRVVEWLWRRGALGRMELALVPCGTCNDLARRLGLERDHWRRWEEPVPAGRLAALTLSRLSMGAGDETVFLNNAGFGRPRDSFERRDPPWRVMFAFRPIRLTAQWEEGRLRGLYYMLLCCNGPYFSGGLHFDRDVSPEDGELRFYLVPARSKARLALQLLRGRAGWPMSDGKTTKITAARVTVETEAPVWPQADGEPPRGRPADRLEFAVLPERVRLWVPQ